MLEEKSHRYSFNHTALSHFDYHWLWGLRCHQHRPDNNLATAIQALVEDDLRDQLQQQQQAVTKCALIIQWLYRWFNLDDYAYHTYQLAAYESNQFTSIRYVRG
jgi:hypothetical protein